MTMLMRNKLNVYFQGQVPEILDDETQERFWIASKKNEDLAYDRLKRHYAWYQEVKPDRITEHHVRTARQSKLFQYIGQSTMGHPIIYAKCQRVNITDAEFINYVLYTLEDIIKNHMDHQKKIIWIWDLELVSIIRDCDKKMLNTCRNMFRIFQEHYPERSYMQYVINYPFMFGPIWKVMSTFIDKDTASKIKFCKNKYILQDIMVRSEIPDEYK